MSVNINYIEQAIKNVQDKINKNCKHKHIGQIPLYNFISYMLDRQYNKELFISYVKDVYNIDITDDLNYLEYDEWGFYPSIDIIEDFNAKYPLKYKDDGTRTYFDNYGRQRYINFIRAYNLSPCYDYAFHLMPWSTIHHIYPLTYSSDNSIQNLIHVSDFSHQVLHLNPHEHNRQACFQAVDYLYYLVNGRSEYLFKKYNLFQFGDNPEIGYQALQLAIKNEMINFYKSLKIRIT